MKAYLQISFAFALVVFSGCASLGLTTPQTLDQKIGYAYGGVTAALNTIATATTAGTLSSAQAENANRMTLDVKSILDTAHVAEGTNTANAASDLALAVAALTEVQKYLTANGVKP